MNGIERRHRCAQPTSFPDVTVFTCCTTYSATYFLPLWIQLPRFFTVSSPSSSHPTCHHHTHSFSLCLQVGGDRSKKSSGGKKGKSFSFLCLTHIDARTHGAPLHPRLWEMDFTFLPLFMPLPSRVSWGSPTSTVGMGDGSPTFPFL